MNSAYPPRAQASGSSTTGPDAALLFLSLGRAPSQTSGMLVKYARQDSREIKYVSGFVENLCGELAQKNNSSRTAVSAQMRAP
jgi:hypothetical protein